MAGEKVLIIDDSLDQREMIADYLKLREYRMMTASDGFQGLQKAREHRPDLILLDLQMPRMDGTEVLKRLKQEQLEIPVILMTGHGSEEIAVGVFRHGVKDYLIKPFGVDELLEAVDRSLTEVRLRKQEMRLRREKDEITEKLLQSNARFNKRQRDLKILFSVGKSVAGRLDRDTLLIRIVGAATMLTSSREGYLFLLDDGQLMGHVVKGFDDERPVVVQSEVSDALAEQAIASKQVQFDAYDAAQNGQGGGSNLFVSALAVPIISANRCLGALLVRSPEAQRYTEYDSELVSALADYAAVVLDRETRAGEKIETQESERLIVPPLPPTKSVFVSYSHANWDEFVEPLVGQMRAEGLRVWIDKDAMESGEDWLDKINELLEASDYLVLCVTPEALLSPIVRMEYRYFFHRKKRILPLICKPANLPAELLGIQHEPYAHVDRLILWLKRRMHDKVI